MLVGKIFGTILIVCGILGILATITIVAWFWHWAIGAICGGLCAIAIGSFIIDLIDKRV